MRLVKHEDSVDYAGDAESVRDENRSSVAGKFAELTVDASAFGSSAAVGSSKTITLAPFLISAREQQPLPLPPEMSIPISPRVPRSVA